MLVFYYYLPLLSLETSLDIATWCGRKSCEHDCVHTGSCSCMGSYGIFTLFFVSSFLFWCFVWWPWLSLQWSFCISKIDHTINTSLLIRRINTNSIYNRQIDPIFLRLYTNTSTVLVIRISVWSVGIWYLSCKYNILFSQFYFPISTQMEQFNTIRRATANLRSMSNQRDCLPGSGQQGTSAANDTPVSTHR